MFEWLTLSNIGSVASILGLDDLLSTVRYQTTGVRNFLDEIIDEDKLEPESREVSHSR